MVKNIICFEIEQINLKYCRSRPIFKKNNNDNKKKHETSWNYFYAEAFLIGVVKIVLIPYLLGLVIPCFENDVDPCQPASQKVTDQNQLFTTLPLNQPYNLILFNTYGGKLGISVTY